MKSKSCLYALLFLLIGVSFSLQAKETSLAETLKQFNNAFIRADIQKLDLMLADDYQHTNSGNKPIDKQSWLKWVSSRKEAVKNRQLVYQEYDTEDLIIQQHQNFAVVTGRNIASGTNANKPFKVDIRFTHVWIKEQQQWKRLTFHDAPSKD